ncbi:hypothetical protein BY458DRAFT_560707 [Sporodiniella umbellata]|nr:hypothetical protein BY458DRAFT_560707 [Sporodiniella umbellata]
MSEIMENDDSPMTDSEKLRARVRQLQERLSQATEKHKKLKKELLEEDISYLVVSKLTNVFADPTIVEKEEITNAQQKIFQQMREAVKASCVQEMVSYHRLSGRTTFTFKNRHMAVRLETFYKNTYKEPYYLLFLKSKAHKVDRHTIPPFIPIDELEKKFMPNNYETFIRIIHDCVQAYVSRRERIDELVELSETHELKILSGNRSKSKVELRAQLKNNKTVWITITYENKTSTYPTKVKVTEELSQSPGDHLELEQLLLSCNDLVGTLQNLLIEKEQQLMDIVGDV